MVTKVIHHPHDEVVRTLRKLANQLESGEIYLVRADGDVEWRGSTVYTRHITIDCEFVGRDVKFR